MAATVPSTPTVFRVQRKSFQPGDGAPSREFPLGISGFRYPDLFEPTRLRDLFDTWSKELAKQAPDVAKAYEAYRTYLLGGAGGTAPRMTPEQVSEVLLVVAPYVSAFVGRLFRIEKEMAALAGEVKDRTPLWRFKQDFAKKRVLKDSAGKAWTGTLAEAGAVATAAVAALRGAESFTDEELAVAKAVMLLFEVDDVARKAAKAGGASWTDELRARAVTLRQALSSSWNAQKVSEAACAVETAGQPTDAENHRVVAFALDAIEAWLAHRRKDHGDPAHQWPSLRVPKPLDYNPLVQLRRPEPKLPELFVGPEHEIRERDGFALTDRRAGR